jgi:hypothetical protein
MTIYSIAKLNGLLETGLVFGFSSCFFVSLSDGSVGAVITVGWERDVASLEEAPVRVGVRGWAEAFRVGMVLVADPPAPPTLAVLADAFSRSESP